MTANTTKEFQVSDHRTADHPVDPKFVNRWSPRAFDGSEMPEADLKIMLEAARWAPSAFNMQPWRFVYSLRGDASWPVFPELMNEFNRSWASNASALIVVLSDTVFAGPDGEKPASHNSFDAGAACAQLALQASALGYHSHSMAGILPEKIHADLNVPERFKAEIMIAVGRRTEPDILPEFLQAKELPSPRRSLEETAFKGSFKG
ncbi:nitroreductase family protein [Roseibium algae]|uniref:Nitroreductase family protein n=1 Tax=Roseibium algae TaxID=3123038 RepID=A0ABU8TGE1_9HYPH